LNKQNNLHNEYNWLLTLWALGMLLYKTKPNYIETKLYHAPNKNCFQSNLGEW